MQKHPRKKMQVVRHVLEGTEALRFLPLLSCCIHLFRRKKQKQNT